MVNADLMYFRPLGGIEMTGMQSGQQGGGCQVPRPHHHPVAAVVRSLRIEVGVVGGNRMITMTLAQQTVKIAGALNFAVVFLTGGVDISMAVAAFTVRRSLSVRSYQAGWARAA